MNTQMLVEMGNFLRAMKEMRIISNKEHPNTFVTEDCISFGAILLATPYEDAEQLVRNGLKEIAQFYGVKIRIERMDCGIRIFIKK